MFARVMNSISNQSIFHFQEKIQCPYPGCQYLGPDAPRNIRHIINNHIKSYPYICQLGCSGVQYNDMTNIRAHYKKHHGEKVFVKTVQLIDCLKTLDENARVYHESIIKTCEQIVAYLNRSDQERMKFCKM